MIKRLVEIAKEIKNQKGKDAFPDLVDLLLEPMYTNIHSDKLNEDALQLLCPALEQTGRKAELLNICRLAHQHHTESWIAARKMVRLNIDKGLDQDAYDILHRFKKIKKFQSDAIVEHAKALADKNNREEAFAMLCKALDRGVQLQPNAFDSISLLGRALEKYETAILYLEIGKERYPNNSTVLKNLAHFCSDYADEVAADDSHKAFRLRERALQNINLLPSKARNQETNLMAFLQDAIINPGQQKRFSKKSKKVRLGVQKVKTSNGAKVDAIQIKARLIKSKKGKLAALQFLVQNIDIENPAVDLCKQATAYAIKVGYYDVAATLLDTIIDRHPTIFQFYNQKAQLLLKKGDDVEAHEVAKKSYNLNQDNQHIALMVALGHASKQEYVEMLDMCRPFIDGTKKGTHEIGNTWQMVALIASSANTRAKRQEIIETVTDDLNFRNHIVKKADEYARLFVPEKFQREIAPIMPWDIKLAKAYRTSRFWEEGEFYPVNRLAYRVSAGAKRMESPRPH